MNEELIARVKSAVEASEKWAENGWRVTFGPRGEEVSSLTAAEALPRPTSFRREAVNYWRQAQLTGHDAAVSGRKAIRALEAGDEPAALDALYFCRYIEAPFAEQARTWGPLYESMTAGAACC
ncbi:hypothetical protein [Chlorobium sp. N1]|uniref:hypothetical protein n=1 Tax=Chlorobium sp. N1 TaxID=2491138 RepID=UPI00103CD40F|nr:hypothetical protein [Chlorobium sp. N1]TCD48232.1 hypothetical protein E0L29_04960 [Chlorobium sp. N1]